MKPNENGDTSQNEKTQEILNYIPDPEFKPTEEETTAYELLVKAATTRPKDWNEISSIDDSFDFQEAAEWVQQVDPEAEIPTELLAEFYIVEKRNEALQSARLAEIRAELEETGPEDPAIREKLISLLYDPNRQIHYGGKTTTVGKALMDRDLEPVSVWEMGEEPILQRNHREGLELGNMEQFGWKSEAEIKQWLTKHFTPQVLERIDSIDYVASVPTLMDQESDRGESYINPKTGAVSVRVYEHSQEISSSVDKEFTVAHELGHAIYSMMSPTEQEQWKQFYLSQESLVANTQAMLGDKYHEEELTEEALGNFCANITIQGWEKFKQKYGQAEALLAPYMNLE